MEILVWLPWLAVVVGIGWIVGAGRLNPANGMTRGRLFAWVGLIDALIFLMLLVGRLGPSGIARWALLAVLAVVLGAVWNAFDRRSRP